MSRIQRINLVASSINSHCQMKTQIVDFFESMFRTLYGWIASNDEILGKIVYTVHMFIIFTIVVLVVISHTIYPMFWFQVFVFCIVFIIWLQHILLRTCVLTSLERRFMGKETPTSVDVALELFGIPVMKETRRGVTFMASTFAIVLLGLELIARSSMFFRTNIGASVWI